MSDDTRNASLLPVPRRGDRSLFQHPQYLGILPTGWWWSWRHIAKAGWIAGPLAAAMGIAVVLLAPGPIWTLSGLLMVPQLSLGITERIFRTISARRQARSSPD